MQLLIADDDSEDIELFQETLENVQPDAELIVTRSGREAISGLRACKPAVIFLDINIPEMNGWECLKHLKSDASFKDIPVIIYTTSSAKSDVDIASSLGADRLVTKPDRFQDLLKILSGIIREIGGPNGSPA